MRSDCVRNARSRPILPDEDCSGPPASRRHGVALIFLQGISIQDVSPGGQSTTVNAHRTARILTKAPGTEETGKKSMKVMNFQQSTVNRNKIHKQDYKLNYISVDC